MLHYLKMSLRVLWKSRGYGILNIAGLTLGITCAALIFLWVDYELSYDSHIKDNDRIYQIYENQTYDGTTVTFAATPGPLAAAMQQEIAGIEKTARCTWLANGLFSLGEKKIFEDGYYADSSLIDLLSVEMIHGRGFDQRYSIVISNRMANRFFGNEIPIGKSIRMNNRQDYIITGVFKDLPDNSTHRFDWLVPYEVYYASNDWLQFWANNGIQTFVKLAPSVKADDVNKKLQNFITEKDKTAIAQPFLFAATDWRLYNKFTNGKQDGGRITYIRIFTTIAWLLIIIACINFMNLATATADQRAKEVGIRKVVGVTKWMLIRQFLAESLFASFIATALSVGLIYLSLPYFRQLTESAIVFEFFSIKHLTSLLLIWILSGCIAGMYPAFYLSSFKPIQVLKGFRLRNSISGMFIRRGLVITQFSLSIILMIATIVIYKQLNHVQSRDIGYNKSGLLYFELNRGLRKQYTAIRNELKSKQIIEEATLCTSNVLQFGMNSDAYTWEQKDPDKGLLITQESINETYFETLGMKLVAGRTFKSDLKQDSGKIIINETFAKIINPKSVIGHYVTVKQTGERLEIVGVVKDFLYNNMYNQPSPIMMFADTSNVNFMVVRMNQNKASADVLDEIKNVFKKFNPDYPFEYYFLDESFSRLFKTEKMTGTLATVFAFLTIIISAIGLFGLSAYTIFLRRKEVSIRKVLGASEHTLVMMLSKNFLSVVCIACLIAFPTAWWLLSEWLSSYAYRINLSWWIFLITGLVSVAVVILTIAYHAVRMAYENPVKYLRNNN